MKINCLCAVLSRVWLFATTWSVAHQAPLSMGFSRQEYWSGHHFLLQGIFLSRGWKPHLLHLLHWQAYSLPLRHLESSNLLQLKKKKKARATMFCCWNNQQFFLIFHQYLSGLSHPAKIKLVFLLVLIFIILTFTSDYPFAYLVILDEYWIVLFSTNFQLNMEPFWHVTNQINFCMITEC